MRETHRIHRSMLEQWIEMSQILIKMIKINGGPSMSQLMHLIFEGLKYFPNNFLITVKIIGMIHKKIELISIIIFKNRIKRKHCASGYDFS